MKRIVYNIASDKVIDRKHMVISVLLIIVSSMFFVFWGVRNISNVNSNLKEKINRRKFYKAEKRKIADNEQSYKDKITVIKNKWGNKVTFANKILRAKAFSFIEQLEFFEEILPEMIQIKEISLDSNIKGNIRFTVSSYSTENLYELYSKLVDNNLIIISESEKNGIYISRLRINLKK